MKVSDDYRAKIRMWAAKPVVVAAPPARVYPKFSSVRFASHEEMNRWKEAYLCRIARELPQDG